MNEEFLELWNEMTEEQREAIMGKIGATARVNFLRRNPDYAARAKSYSEVFEEMVRIAYIMVKNGK